MQAHYGNMLSLTDVLAAKEKKAKIQEELRETYETPVVGIAINMPGNLKYSQDTVDLLYAALHKLRLYLHQAQFALLEERVYHDPAGPVAILAVDGAPDIIKEYAVAVEEEDSYSRLVDIDVFDVNGRQVSRCVLNLKSRRCLICSQSAVECIRARTHPLAEVQAAAQKLIADFHAARTQRWPDQVSTIGTVALEAMLMEAACAPAPGLVDRFNPGAHRDMDFFTFMKGSSALAPAMYRCAQAGWRHRGSEEELLPVLRRIGSAAEKDMFAATNGVNTQKGLIFLLGVMTAAAAIALRRGWQGQLSEAVAKGAAAICRGIVERELGILHQALPGRKITAGERLFLAYGVAGIRGEVEAGLPVVMAKGLPGLHEAFANGLSINDSLLHALLGIMSETQDTTILNRHDMATLEAVQKEAGLILAEGGMLARQGYERIRKLDEQYSQKNISPGGSADLLAATYFLYRLEENFGK